MIEQLHGGTRTALKFALAATLAGWCGFAAADDAQGDLLFPWEAHGKLYATGPDTLMLLGEVEGTLYAESASGKFDGATIVCPMLQEINVTDRSVRGEGRCAIFPTDGDDVIFATYVCTGKLGVCEGSMELTGGTGKYQDMQGTGAMASRTGMADLAVKLGPGGSITNAEGLMRVTGLSGCSK